jgi:L-amino acid N-acyltransferase YncA
MLNIRAAESKDRDAVWNIFSEIVPLGETYVYPPDTSREDALRIWLEAPQAAYVAERNARILGTYYLKTNQPGRGSHVCNAGYMVAQSAQGQGIGQAMCAHSLDEAKRLGYSAMQYNLVVSTNLAAVRLWQKMGFEIAGRLPKAFQHARFGLVEAYVMYRLL